MGRSIAYQPARESQGATEFLERCASADECNRDYLTRVYDVIDAEVDRTGVSFHHATVCLANGVRP